ncbi:MAG TPA: TlpA disulfide reductase family protein [Burkholderiales bacterium]|nr:TlpA disulfide reductase family protein [Burkholderiales bacterium]
MNCVLQQSRPEPAIEALTAKALTGYRARRAVLALLLMLSGLLTVVAARAVPEIDAPAPPLKGTLFSGQSFDLQQMRGKVVLINFYSSYCKFCAYEIGVLEAFYEEHRKDGFEVIAVGVDDLQDRERVERNLTLYHLPGCMAGALSENGFARRYPTPTAFLIDRAGILRHRITGAKGPSFYREHILPLLGEVKR